MEKLAIIFRLSSKCAGGSMDRASDSGSEGWGFESLPACQKCRYPSGYLHFCISERKGIEQLNARLRWSLARCGLDRIDTIHCAKAQWQRVPSGVPKRNCIDRCRSRISIHLLIAAPVCALVQKVSGGHFLARGRVLQRQDASGMDVDCL